MKPKTCLVALLACASFLLAGCGGAPLAQAVHEHVNRESCRGACSYSAYESGVTTECYGDCMSDAGYFCHRDFEQSCSEYGCSDVYKDNFDCEPHRDLSQEYVACVDDLFSSGEPDWNYRSWGWKWARKADARCSKHLR